MMKQASFERHVGAVNICVSIQDALLRAAELHHETLVREQPAFVENASRPQITSPMALAQ
jgi:hypothetical protein